jgi:cobalt-zinc-cadmium efflux system membrane fusion protein
VELHDHTPTPRARAFLWGAVLGGVLLLVLFLTHGFGLLAPRVGAPEPAALVHEGAAVHVPEGSALRGQITLQRAEGQPVRPQLHLPAVIEADPARTVAVLSPLTGRVTELKVALGERVSAGQVLALLDSPELAQAYADNARAVDSFALATRNLERVTDQQKIGAASMHDVDQARSEHTQASAEYTRTRERLRMLGAPEQPGARAGVLGVRAAVAGSITALSIARGDWINDSTQSLMTLADLSTVWVTVLAPEEDVGALSEVQDVDIVLDAYPGEVLRGHVLSIADVIEADSRRNKVRIALPNPRLRLKPNMYATATLLGSPETRIVLPTSALLMNNDRTSVFVATAPWTFERRTVELRLQEGQSVAIRSGVNPGEQVVVSGAVLLQ